jgi:hypothetical protein
MCRRVNKTSEDIVSIMGTEFAVENLSSGRTDTSLKDAPWRDLKAADRAFVSIAPFIRCHIS